MISGALLLGREEPLKKHGERLLRFLIALVVWSVVYYIWNRAFMKTEYDLKEILYVPTEPHLWYLYAMIPIYMVLPFFQVMCKGMSGKLERALLVVCSASVVFNYVVSLQNGEAYYDLPLIGDKVYMLYIFIGHFIYKYRRYIRISQKWAAAIFYRLYDRRVCSDSLYHTAVRGAIMNGFWNTDVRSSYLQALHFL